MLRPVVAARASILVTTGGARGGLANSFAAHPCRVHSGGHALASISEDSSSAMAPMMVNMARPMGLSVSTSILDADKAHAEMIEFFKRHQQMPVLRANRSEFSRPARNRFHDFWPPSSGH